MDISFDAVFVGAGPAGLAGAIHLKHLAKKDPALRSISIAVIEKAPNLGDHSLSGATFDTRALQELLPDLTELKPPLGPTIVKESLSFLTKKFAFTSPVVPWVMSNKGKRMVSLSDLVRWLGKIAEAEGIQIFTGEAVDELIFDAQNKVVGVRIKGKGTDKSGHAKPNFLPATEVGAKVVVLAEGSRGHITKSLIKKFNLDEGKTPQGHAVGLKELWEVKEKHFVEGMVCNTMGFPLDLKTFGGGFIYHIKDSMVAIGLVVGLDYKDPTLHPFEQLQKFKMHPFVSKILEGGRFVAYGAKTITEGGYYAMPKSFGNGFLIVGEAGGVLDAMKLKGIDPAIKSGMLASEVIRNALLKNDLSSAELCKYEESLKNSWVGKDMWRARNFHQGFHGGVVAGFIHTSLQIISFGRGLIDKFRVKEDRLCTEKLSSRKICACEKFKPNGRTTFDKLTCVFASGTKHEEDQPCHIKVDDFAICNGKCTEEFGNPCQFFCPANVFEMVEEEDGKKRLHLNPTNCLHCKTCDIKDPYAIVTWVPPEGGGGPNYKGM